MVIMPILCKQSGIAERVSIKILLEKFVVKIKIN